MWACAGGHRRAIWVEAYEGEIKRYTDLLDEFLQAFPDLHFDDYTIHTTGREPMAAVGWHLSATTEAPLDPPGFAATHKPVAISGACLYEFGKG